MTPVCCPSCRLRFTAAASAYIVACPECGKPPQQITSLEGTLGFRLFDPKDLATGLPQAIADSIRVPEFGHDRD
jgi:hypothetical protein